jgi:hypothetical protein
MDNDIALYYDEVLPIPDLPLGNNPLLYDDANGVLMIGLIPDSMYEDYILHSKRKQL